MIRLLGIGSSPRAGEPHAMYDSLSTVMLQSVLETAGKFSGDCVTEMIHLGRMNIHPCKGCFSDMETRCHYLCDCYDDDFTAIAQKIIDADAVIFAGPTYMFGMSSVLENKGRAIVQLVQLTKGRSRPEMPKILHKDKTA